MASTARRLAGTGPRSDSAPSARNHACMAALREVLIQRPLWRATSALQHGPINGQIASQVDGAIAPFLPNDVRLVRVLLHLPQPAIPSFLTSNSSSHSGTRKAWNMDVWSFQPETKRSSQSLTLPCFCTPQQQTHGETDHCTLLVSRPVLQPALLQSCYRLSVACCCFKRDMRCFIVSCVPIPRARLRTRVTHKSADQDNISWQ
ncbi:hypothetical protein FB567DRAFT_325504 [Paraphoma chrysanthemicola]|uniref:Uncharacterized protein n=1 Tax=Paraphoma chrysanthemicola TaxID=798071 RepID=A0A8K0R9Q6_9PLEO|nr:hypothetical protein FB567DRAFT_325504 [Paraphoma chrysanthemicola]